MQPNTSIPSVLEVLTKTRLGELGRGLGLRMPEDQPKELSIKALQGSPLSLHQLLSFMGRDELRAACRAHQVDDTGRSRSSLAARLIPGQSLQNHFETTTPRDYSIPQKGDVIEVRHRQYLVTEVIPPPEANQMTRVCTVCLDDDAQGRPLEVLWELELGARVLAPEASGLGEPSQLDQPRNFAAYLHALKWSSVTATNAKLFQAPFRAGIQLLNHQLTPLKKALGLPRANLFIADDVGLGKTIEAGLVLTELLLRQRVEWALIVCPASVALQWRDEMERKFGLYFEIYNRPFVARRRQERGFSVNPRGTHTRFIISYQTLRRPEYRDPLLEHLRTYAPGNGARLRKSLLILDEAHTAAPSSATKYAVDSRVTKVIRDVAPRFENRLFLSATPHNGHSNSFSALLEILDPQRFTRGVPVQSVKQLEPVMVRRLKSDLKTLGTEGFPLRHVVPLSISYDAANDKILLTQGSQAPINLGLGNPIELTLSSLLAEYTALVCPDKGNGRLVFLNLQKRLLSSTEAFWRTLQRHAKAVLSSSPAEETSEPDDAENEEEYGVDDDLLEEVEGTRAESNSRRLPKATGRAKELLNEMLDLSTKHRNAPDAKMQALLHWIKQNQCAAVEFGGSRAKGKPKWSERRLLIFTEYGDSKRYLQQLLSSAIEGTDQANKRILVFHGGMSDEAREEVQRAFNSSPTEHPVRILIATDAAREGINLQAFCKDLIHFDIPWNPARMEQRNGRIDRTLQPSPEVHCYYFVYPQRTEDQVLDTLVKKVERIQRELGSLGQVILERFQSALESGISQRTLSILDKAEDVGALRAVTERELESQRELKKVKEEIDEAGKILNDSRQVMEFNPALLQDALEVGFSFSGAKGFQEIHLTDKKEELNAFSLPALPHTWDKTIDSLRPPRARDESFSDWRKKAPLPVVFTPPTRLDSGVVHLHLSHPLVRRVLGRFMAQGYAAHDLSRVSVVRNPHDSLVRVIAFARLSLFGPGATRLHDRLLSIAAQWLEGSGSNHLKPFQDKADRKAIEYLEELLQKYPTLEEVGPKVQERLLRSAPQDFASLWEHLKAEAESQAHDAKQLLSQRANEEAEALRKILLSQRDAIDGVIHNRTQFSFDFTDTERQQKEQFEQDRLFLARRREEIQGEIDAEPVELAETYRVVLERLEPVGMIYLWPTTR